MENKLSVLIVEDEAIVALGLEDTLQQEGYQVAGVADNGKEALAIVNREPVDLVLLDIHIQGDWDGIETARRLTAVREMPLIYLTAFSDSETVERARQTLPAAYLTKPYQARNLLITIDLALHNFAFRKQEPGKMIPLRDDRLSPADRSATASRLPGSPDRKESILYFNEAVYFKQNYKYIKVAVANILYLEADGNHTNVHTTDTHHVIRYTLNTLLEKLGQPDLVRIHRSYAVNFRHVSTFNDHTVCLGEKELSLGRHYKDDFFGRFDFL